MVTHDQLNCRKYYSADSIIEAAPPNYSNSNDYPFSPSPLPSYDDTISQLSQSWAFDTYTVSPSTSTILYGHCREMKVVATPCSVVIISSNAVNNNNNNNNFPT